jgi:hypothetical protein
VAADLRAFRQWAVDRLQDLERAVATTTDARARSALVASTVAELEVERDRALEAMHLRRWESWDRACAQLDELSGGGTEDSLKDLWCYGGTALATAAARSSWTPWRGWRSQSSPLPLLLPLAGGEEERPATPIAPTDPPPPRIAAASFASRGRTRTSCIRPCRS